MPGIIFVVNEWLLEDLLGHNGNNKRSESFAFLQALQRKGDAIAVLEDSAWMQKAYNLAKRTDHISRLLSRFLHLEILQNSNACILITQNQIEGDLEEVLLKTPQSDVYLVITYINAGAEALITTDFKLIQALSTLTSIGINTRLRDEFLADYLIT